jgi:hypothetical protein
MVHCFITHGAWLTLVNHTSLQLQPVCPYVLLISNYNVTQLFRFVRETAQSCSARFNDIPEIYMVALNYCSIDLPVLSNLRVNIRVKVNQSSINSSGTTLSLEDFDSHKYVCIVPLPFECEKSSIEKPLKRLTCSWKYRLISHRRRNNRHKI